MPSLVCCGKCLNLWFKKDLINIWLVALLTYLVFYGILESKEGQLGCCSGSWYLLVKDASMQLELTIKRAAKTVYQVVTLGIFIVTSLDKLAKSIILIAFKVPLWMHQVLVKKNNLTHSLPPPLALLLFVIDLKDQVFNEVI